MAASLQGYPFKGQILELGEDNKITLNLSLEEPEWSTLIYFIDLANPSCEIYVNGENGSIDGNISYNYEEQSMRLEGKFSLPSSWDTLKPNTFTNASLKMVWLKDSEGYFIYFETLIVNGTPLMYTPYKTSNNLSDSLKTRFKDIWVDSLSPTTYSYESTPLASYLKDNFGCENLYIDIQHREKDYYRWEQNTTLPIDQLSSDQYSLFLEAKIDNKEYCFDTHPVFYFKTGENGTSLSDSKLNDGARKIFYWYKYLVSDSNYTVYDSMYENFYDTQKYDSDFLQPQLEVKFCSFDYVDRPIQSMFFINLQKMNLTSLVEKIGNRNFDFLEFNYSLVPNSSLQFYGNLDKIYIQDLGFRVMKHRCLAFDGDVVLYATDSDRENAQIDISLSDFTLLKEDSSLSRDGITLCGKPTSFVLTSQFEDKQINTYYGEINEENYFQGTVRQTKTSTDSVYLASVIIYWTVAIQAPKIFLSNTTPDNKKYIRMSDGKNFSPSSIKFGYFNNGKWTQYTVDDDEKILSSLPPSETNQEYMYYDNVEAIWPCYCITPPLLKVPLSTKIFFPWDQVKENVYDLSMEIEIQLNKNISSGKQADFIKHFSDQFYIEYKQNQCKFSNIVFQSGKYIANVSIPVEREDEKFITLNLKERYSGVVCNEQNVSVVYLDGTLPKPIVNPTIPAAFMSNTNYLQLSIPFDYDQEAFWAADAQSIEIKIFDMNNNLIENYSKTQFSLSERKEDKFPYEYSLVLQHDKIFQIGLYYKVSFRFNYGAGVYSPWSNVTIFKVTAEPKVIRMPWWQDDNFILNDVIQYLFNQDTTEPLKKIEYQYKIQDDANGWEGKLPLETIDIDYIPNNYSYTLTLKSLLDYPLFRQWNRDLDNIGGDGTDVLLEIKFFTKNGIFNWISDKRTFWRVALGDPAYDIDFSKEPHPYSIESINAHGNVLIDPKGLNSFEMDKSQLKWRVYNNNTLLAQQSNLKENLVDFSAEYSNSYDFFTIGKTFEGDTYLHYSTLPNIICDFDGAYLIDVDKNIQLNITLNNAINSLKCNILETKTDVIGSQYPVFFRNPYVNYREFPLSGTISYQSLVIFENEFGLDFTVQNPHLNLTGDNLYLERIFREKVVKFLTEDRPLLYKSQTEGNVVVKLMNIQLTPNKTLGRMIYDFSCTCYEVQDLQSYLNDCREGK